VDNILILLIVICIYFVTMWGDPVGSFVIIYSCYCGDNRGGLNAGPRQQLQFTGVNSRILEHKPHNVAQYVFCDTRPRRICYGRRSSAPLLTRPKSIYGISIFFTGVGVFFTLFMAQGWPFIPSPPRHPDFSNCGLPILFEVPPSPAQKHTQKY